MNRREFFKNTLAAGIAAAIFPFPPTGAITEHEAETALVFRSDWDFWIESRQQAIFIKKENLWNQEPETQDVHFGFLRAKVTEEHKATIWKAFKENKQAQIRLITENGRCYEGWFYVSEIEHDHFGGGGLKVEFRSIGELVQLAQL